MLYKNLLVLVSCAFIGDPIILAKKSDKIQGSSSSKINDLTNVQLANDNEALAFIKENPKVHIMLFWPVVAKIENQMPIIIKELSRYCIFHYKKTVYLKNDGPLMLVRHAYAFQDEKTGICDDDFSRARKKVHHSFKYGKILYAFVVSTESYGKMRKIKDLLRDHFDLNFLHTSDNHEEALVLGRTLFSEATLNFLNTHTTHCNRKFDNVLNDYRQLLKHNKIDPAYCCIVGESIQTVLGFGDCDKVAFIQEPTKKLIPSITNVINLTKNNAYEVSIITDPRKHFYYFGLKFAIP